MPLLVCRCDEFGRLVIVLRSPYLPRLIGRARRREDERAGLWARRLALESCDSSEEATTISISHTEGSAAALARPGSQRIGVDLVLATRVTQRHANAVLTRKDWAALDSIPPPLRAPLGWAMKEATAKATGAAQLYFPTRIRLLSNGDSGSPRAQCIGGLRSTFDVDWLVLGGLLCATVVEIDA